MEILNEKIQSIIIDYLNDTISLEGELTLKEWLSESETNKKLFSNCIETWRIAILSDTSERFNASTAWNEVKKRINGTESSNQPAKRRSITHLRTFLAAAASLAAGILLTCLYTHLQTNSHTEQFVNYTVPAGSHSEVSLPDGSTVTMNSGSRLTYSDRFGTDNRNVTLKGEAYFEVAKNKKMPFVVQIDNEIEVRVLGTKFNVSAYPDENDIEVTLKEGLIEAYLSNSGENILVKPNEQLVFDRSVQSLTKTRVDSEASIAWRQNKLIFDNTDFNSIIRVLERKYDIDIITHNEKLLTERYSGEFVNGENLSDIFRIISSGNRFRYKIRGKTVDIY